MAIGGAFIVPWDFELCKWHVEEKLEKADIEYLSAQYAEGWPNRFWEGEGLSSLFPSSYKGGAYS